MKSSYLRKKLLLLATGLGCVLMVTEATAVVPPPSWVADSTSRKRATHQHEKTRVQRFLGKTREHEADYTRWVIGVQTTHARVPLQRYWKWDSTSSQLPRRGTIFGRRPSIFTPAKIRLNHQQDRRVQTTRIRTIWKQLRNARTQEAFDNAKVLLLATLHERGHALTVGQRGELGAIAADKNFALLWDATQAPMPRNAAAALTESWHFNGAGTDLEAYIAEKTAGVGLPGGGWMMLPPAKGNRALDRPSKHEIPGLH